MRHSWFLVCGAPIVVFTLFGAAGCAGSKHVESLAGEEASVTTTAGPGDSEASGATQLDRIRTRCAAVELSYTHGKMGESEKISPVVVRSGQVVDPYGTPWDAAESGLAISAGANEVVVVRNLNSVLEKARCVEGGSATMRDIDWNHFTYTVGEEAENVMVVDGNYSREDPEDQMFFHVLNVMYGDLDHDGADEAVVITSLNTGGSGQFTDALVYTMRENRPVLLGTLPRGDRGNGGIDYAAVKGGTVELRRFQSMEGEGACCPSHIQSEMWAWDGKAFVEDEKARKLEKISK